MFGKAKDRPPKKPMTMYQCTITIIILLAVLMLIISRFSPLFCDLYARFVYGFFTAVFARITSVIPFALGELLLALVLIFLLLSLPLYFVIKKYNADFHPKLKNAYSKIFSLLFTFIIATGVFNCLIMYNCSPLTGKDASKSGYSQKTMDATRQYIADNVNALAEKVSRNNDGNMIFSCDASETARSAVRALGEKYPRLGGFCPKPKEVADSFLMSQMGITGVFSPFTLEANYSGVILDSKKAFVMCHELAHVRGYMNEAEANFIAFLACINSDSVDFQYAGYLFALEQINKSYDSVPVYASAIYDYGKYYPDTYWSENADKEFIPTEIVSEVSTKVNDTYLKVNGIESGVANYSQVVGLILDYFNSK